jgi:hypothetical protein
MSTFECLINNDCDSIHTQEVCNINNNNIDLVDIKSIPNYKIFETDGFEYYSNDTNGIDIEGEEMTNYIDSINTQHRDGNYKINELKYKDLHFYEYLYMKYLEIKYEPYKCKKIMDNIFYINGKIIYFLTDNFLGKVFSCQKLKDIFDRNDEIIENCRTNTSLIYGIRLSIGENVVIDDATNSPDNSNIILPPLNRVLPMSPSLHIDFNSFDKYQKLETDDDRFNKYVNKTVTESFFSATEPESMYQQMDGFFDKNIEIFNIWTMLDCSENAKSLSFLDIGINKRDILYKLNMKEQQLYKYIFGLNVNYNRVLSDDTINNALYTFNNMSPGDFLVFKSSEIPHTSVTQDNNTWRISCEVRYAAYEDEVPFDIGINGVFNDRYGFLIRNENYNPTYFGNNIQRYFQMEYIRIKDLYNAQLDQLRQILISGDFNLDIFESIIDNMLYKEYLDDEKVTEYIIENF